MGTLDDAYANKSLDAVLGSGHASNMPATVYFGLTVAGTEVSGGAYARVAATNNTTNFPAASGRAKTIAGDQTFPQPTGTWGTVDGWAMYDASTAGVRMGAGALASARSVTSASNPPVIPAGSTVLTA